MSYGLLLVRVVVGATLFGHGAQKLFGWWGGQGPKGTGGFFGRLGYRAPTLIAVLAGLSEACGMLLALGLVTPLACLAIAVVMLSAIAAVHWKNGFWNSAGGIEFPLVVLSVVTALAATGPGRFAIDRAIGWDDNISGLWWGVGVLGLALVISAVIHTLGRHREPARGLQTAS